MSHSPPIDRSLESLAPIFKAPLLAWLEEASDTVRHVDFRITETGRSEARQRWLYAQGRQSPHRENRVVTWTLDSRHRWGLAADLAMIRKDTGQAIWTISSWEWLYRVVPPEVFGLRHLGPQEWVHLEYRYANEAIREKDKLELTHL